jgi:very-short-patch-repair endonuclease
VNLATPGVLRRQIHKRETVGGPWQHLAMTELPWPFVGSEALAARLIPERAMRTLYEPVYPGVYMPWGVAPSATERAKAAWLWSRRRGVVAGQSAAAMLGTKWVHDNRRPPAKLVVHTETLAPGEIVDVDGVAVTTAPRTAFDLGRHTPVRLHAVQRLDALANATDVKLIDVESVMATHPGARGIPRLRRVLSLVDGGAESPQETLTRLVLIDAGLPRPRTQIQVYNEYGDFVARVDMGYDEVLVGIEYDGPQHWTDPAIRQRDIDKQVELQDLGWRMIRASRDLLKFRRATFVGRVATALRDAGLTW